MLAPLRRRALRLRPFAESLDDRCLLSGLTPAQITQAYGLNAITFANGTVKGDGTGQTIALVEAYHNPSIASDLRVFDAANNLPDPALQVVNLGSGQMNDGWASETMLDVEWAHAIAPGAKILVVEANSETQTDLLAAVDVARTMPGVSVVSMSWGFTEFAGENQYDYHFTTPAGHQGVTFLSASGDSGSQNGAEWPSASPNVVSVGGTSLHLNSSGGIASESAWIDGGGGLSLFEPEPAYQMSAQSTGVRSTPDVSFDADPASGVQVYYTSPLTGQGSWQTIGGTSLGSPAWAGIIAIVDQGLSLAGKSSLDGATQTLPALYALGAGNWGDFNTVSATTTTTGHGGGGWFNPFGGNYFGSTTISTNPLTSTALGTPNGLKLVTDLVATPFAATSTSNSNTTPATPTISNPASHKKKKVHHPVKKKVKTVVHRKAVHHSVIDVALAELAAE